MDEQNLLLSEMTSATFVCSGPWQPRTYIIDVRTEDISRITSMILNHRVEESGSLRISDTSEIVMVYAMNRPRLRVFKTRVATMEPEKVIEAIRDEFEVVQ